MSNLIEIREEYAEKLAELQKNCSHPDTFYGFHCDEKHQATALLYKYCRVCGMENIIYIVDAHELGEAVEKAKAEGKAAIWIQRKGWAPWKREE